MTPRKYKANEPQSGATLAKDLLEGVLDPLLMLDGELVVKSTNPAFYDAFDLTPEQTLGQRIDHVGDGLWAIPRLQELLQQVQTAGRSFKDYEVTHTFESLGRRTMLLNACTVQPRSEHREKLILLAMKDITSLKETQEALRRSEQTLRMIFENAQEFAIIGMDLDGHVTAWNTGAERLLGYSASEIMGEDARIIFTPEDREQGQPDEELTLAREQGRAENERWHVRKDGSRFWGSGLVSPLYDDQDRQQGLLKIMRDMTTEHRLREEREARARELEQRVAEATAESERRAAHLEAVTRRLNQAEQRERRQLARMLHDDLQQLLVAIKMRLQLAENQSDAGAIAKETQELVDQAIDATRSLSHELSPSVLWERGFVPALHWLGQNILERYQLPVHIEVEEQEKVAAIVPPVVGEPIFQMVRELVFNVVKHAEASEARILVTPLDSQGIRLVVEDDGVGCDPELMAGEEDGGRGLGLRGIRERLVIWQGQINCEPCAEQGCRVTLELPRLVTA